MLKLGIIPAAGKADRFGGIAKELLVAKDGTTLLQHAVSQLSFCDLVLVITTDDKFVIHSKICGDCMFTQQFGDGFINAVFTGLQIEADRYFVVMPDTVFAPSVLDIFGKDIEAGGYNYFYGYFMTRYARRFGVKIGSLWRDKPDLPDLAEPNYKAWGMFGVGRDMRDRWIELRERDPGLDIPDLMTYSESNGRISSGKMTSYHDMASIEDYKEYLCS